MSIVLAKCQKCQKAVTGPSISLPGLVWHPHHFNCVVCGEVIHKELCVLEQGSPVHRLCYAERLALRCLHCDTPIMGDYYPSTRGVFCPKHKNVSSCEFCWRTAEMRPGTDLPKCAP